MPLNVTDVDTFTDPIVEPADSDPADRTYIHTIAQGLSNRTRNLLNRIVYPSPPTRKTFIHATSCFGAYSAGGAAWLFQAFGSAPTLGQRLASTQNFSRLMCALDDHLPTTAQVTQVAAIVAPGATRAGGNRMKLSWFVEKMQIESPFGLSYNGPLDETEDDGTTNFQLITMVLNESPYTTGYPVNRKSMETSPDEFRRGVISLVAGNDAGSNADKVHGFYVTWTDPGLRNY